ncbi:MAG: alkaline phosphatase family protein [Candidatus Aminicenantes bacterium]|nr:alkaline phosphatase family protein [Candidatus Aminicenantes bacterium]
MKNIDRREFIKLGLTAGSLFAFSNASDMVTKVLGKTDSAQKLIILGFDGLDPHLTRVWMDQGLLPAFQKLRATGSFNPLRTGNPPQSPVAWSNFITGMNPGGHGIFDFMHRDPVTYTPTFSAAESVGTTKTLALGNYRFPLSGGEVKNLIKGRAFWQILEDHGIPATIFKMPSNYPPLPSKQRTLSGMNTPDLMGSYGICNYYTSESARVNEDVGGARIHEVYVIGNRVEAQLPGPVNSFKKDSPETAIDFKVFLDPVNPVAKIVIQDHEFILREGEWSEWKKIHYNMIPTQNVHGICNFYLKQIRPEFKLYVSPVNIDPASPALPISTPDSYASDLAKKFGSFYTKGLPGDFKALNNNLIDEDEFLEQDDQVLHERIAMFDYELARFDSGMLFYYVSSTDQRQHMFWRHLDKDNPIYDPKAAAKYEHIIRDIYIEADKMLDKALQKADKDTIVMVVSDHGFSPFRWSFNANTWLLENGYHSLINPWKQGEDIAFMNTDWSRTKAYAYGLNSLYINQKGREGEGIIADGTEKENLVREMVGKLEAFVDPKTGEKPVLKAYVSKDIYTGACVDQAPEIILGFNRGYRISWSSPMGRIPKNIMEDNVEKWSGDHCVSPDIVPGVLFANRPLSAQNPAFLDVTATVLKIFGIEKPKEMTGKSLL